MKNLMAVCVVILLFGFCQKSVKGSITLTRVDWSSIGGTYWVGNTTDYNPTGVGTWALYVSASQNFTQPFINQPGYSLAASLTPGNYTYTLVGDVYYPTPGVPYILNIGFTNSDGTSGNASVMATENLAGSTSDVQGSPRTYSHDDYAVTITEFTIAREGFFGAHDYVGPFSVGANGHDDLLASVSFTVSTIPEPATLMLLTLGGVFLRKRKA
jgi:hypothetical protein